FEDGQPQAISNFSSDTELPLSIAFLFDTSGSVRDKLQFERQAAARFFRSTLRPGADRALLMTFDSRISVLQDFADDPDLLSKALVNIIPGGSTCLYDAVREAAAIRLAKQPGRRVIIIVSDGIDNSSHVSADKAIETAQKN